MKTNQRWYLYVEDGSYYKLENDVLWQDGQLNDGSRAREPFEVDWEQGVNDEADRAHLLKVVEELKAKN
jgi:hypothetical protein